MLCVVERARARHPPERKSVQPNADLTPRQVTKLFEGRSTRFEAVNRRTRIGHGCKRDSQELSLIRSHVKDGPRTRRPPAKPLEQLSLAACERIAARPDAHQVMAKAHMLGEPPLKEPIVGKKYAQSFAG